MHWIAPARLSSPASTAAACWRSLAAQKLAFRSLGRPSTAVDDRTTPAQQLSAASARRTRRRRLDLSPPRAQLHTGNGSGGGPSPANGWLMRPAPAEPLDAILVLGGGLLPNGSLPPWVVRRLEGGLALWRSQQRLHAKAAAPAAAATVAGNGGDVSAAEQPVAKAAAEPFRPCPIVLLGAGTPHKPAVLSSSGHVLHEATAYAPHLMRQGVPASQLLKEVQSFDTVGNGYFSLTIHALPAGWRRLAVVTSDFHMPRTAAIFDTTYRLGGTSMCADPGWFQLHYASVSDAGLLSPEVHEARAAKEAAAVAAWHASTRPMGSLAELHAWMFSTHLCYAVGRQHEFGVHDDLDPRLAATY